MEKKLLIIHTMTRFLISYDEAVILVDQIFKDGKEKEYEQYLSEFPKYSEMIKKYGGKEL